MSAKGADDGEELVTTDCNHEVPREKTVTVPELILCEECYKPAQVTEWPSPLDKSTHYARNRHGTKTNHKTYILGLDRRGRGVYYDENDRRVRTFIPLHDSAYSRDRREKAESLKEHHTPAPGHGVLRPKKLTHYPGGPAPMHVEGFATMPDGDHITEIECTEKIRHHEIAEWIQENVDDWQQVHPDVVERFGLEDRFSTETGNPTADVYCEECGHEEHNVDPSEYTRCPKCDDRQYMQVKEGDSDE